MNIKDLAQFAFSPIYWMLNRSAIEQQARRESDILSVWMVLPIQHTKPTFRQVEALVEEVEQNTDYTTETLYRALATGSIPSAVDTIIKRHEQEWIDQEATK